jgi:hypothetical protein
MTLPATRLPRRPEDAKPAQEGDNRQGPGRCTGHVTGIGTNPRNFGRFPKKSQVGAFGSRGARVVYLSTDDGPFLPLPRHLRAQRQARPASDRGDRGLPIDRRQMTPGPWMRRRRASGGERAADSPAGFLRCGEGGNGRRRRAPNRQTGEQALRNRCNVNRFTLISARQRRKQAVSRTSSFSSGRILTSELSEDDLIVNRLAV